MSIREDDIIAQCPSCLTQIKSGYQFTWCPECQRGFPGSIKAVILGQGKAPESESIIGGEQTESNRVLSLYRRYKDAYLVANTTVGFGASIKVLAALASIIIAFATLFLASLVGEQAKVVGIFVGFVGIVFAVFVGAILFVLGVLIAAQGQVLKASLDSAVNNSPFLTNEQRAKIMLLPKN